MKRKGFLFMRNNYYEIKKRNNRKKNKIKKQLQKNMRIPKINRLTPEERQQSNYRKRQAKKLNYKKVFAALLILILLIYLICSGMSKLVSALISKSEKSKSIETTASVPQDITINMAVVRRYNVPFNEFSRRL